MATPALRLDAATLDSPEPRALALFYSRLLGWPITTDGEDWLKLTAPTGAGLSFQREPGYVRPTWPTAATGQQMMVHLDIEVDDLAAGVEHARACGAEVADFQPQDDVRVCLDPDGHPFCLYVE
jgi:catechol 2,3-dioxygenase-like lactoylglutathione lyase family enzyme